ncbi:EfeM/EfeO family lipoprotein, partial [Pseudomonas viridiflava]|uniref:EfeM/EfeO family lipoprotein n=1 Tax=Pseudomonas viridiflava TaxID=33069 RepID=UPI00178499EB
GFHRIEYTLFEQHSVEGMSPVAQRLQTDVTQLKQQLLAQSLAPEQLAAIVTRNMRSLADVRSSGEEERYSHSDLNGFAANLEGTRKVVDLLRPL